MLFVLLGILMLLLTTAHADDSMEISLHNGDVPKELSVVTNWTLLCEQLCSLNLSGPACGPDCPSAGITVEKVPEEIYEEYNFPPEHQSELCETLCDNGLGGSRCLCPIKINPAALSSFFASERNKICADFCRLHLVTLRGCKQCCNDSAYRMTKPSKATKPPKPPKDSFSMSPVNPHRIDLPEGFQNQPDIQQLAPFDIPADIQASPTPPTTPDWNRLCATLCRQGNGGILCNCDLAPF